MPVIPNAAHEIGGSRIQTGGGEKADQLAVPRVELEGDFNIENTVNGVMVPGAP